MKLLSDEEYEEIINNKEGYTKLFVDNDVNMNEEKQKLLKTSE